MNVSINGGVVRVTLSERNLKTLLSKVQRKGSANTLYSILPEDNVVLYVVAEPDALHYGERIPGRVHPLDEPKESS